MGGKTKKGKGRLDKFYHLAKEQGYRSRAAFKLIQLNRKYNFLGSCRALLDLCAAPGGWLQVAAKNMPMSSLIIGVDLVPIKPIRGVKTLIGDITTQETRAALKKEANGSMFDVVVHDGAPNVGGAWANEAYTQAALVLDSLRLATEFLVPKGTFVTKVFRSKDYNALLYAFNQLFTKVDATKPTASRSTSAEIFVVCTGYKAPSKIDPRLLDPRHLFQEVTEVKKVMGPEALMRQKIKQVRHREGYEDGLSTTHKQASALAFLVSDTPVEMLGQVTKIVLDGPGSWGPAPGVSSAEEPKELAAKIRGSAATTKEVKALCEDLQVLGRTEFKALLRWRLAVRKELGKELAAVQGGEEEKQEGGEKGEGEAPADPEDALLAEMAAVKEAMEKRAKKEKKKAREAKKKARIRAAQLGAGQGPIDDNGPEEMFALRAVAGGSGTLGRVLDAPAPGEADMELLEQPDSSDEDYLGGGSDVGEEDGDEDDERLRYERELDESLERSYRLYLQRKGHREEMAKEKRKRLGKGGELDSEDEEGEEGKQDEDGYAGDSDEDGGSDEGEATDMDGIDDEEEEEGAGAKRKGQQQLSGRKRKEREGASAAADDEDNVQGGGLLVQLDESRAGVAKTGAAMAAQWFGQELFDDPNLIVDDEEEEEEEEEQPKQKQKKQAQGKESAGQPSKASVAKPAAKAGQGAGGGGAAAEAAHAAAGKKQQQAQAAAEDVDEEEDEEDRAAKRRVARDGFEVVPASTSSRKARSSSKQGEEGIDEEGPQSGSGSETDSEDEFDMLDDQGKAEVLALAKRMLRRKEKESIIDAAYNRYAFHDTGLPRWFEEDEARHMRPILPITKEEVEAEKARLRAVDARPIKKVAEAKARQRKRMLGKLQAAREKAEAVAAQEDVPLSSKMREIERLYARARATGKKGKGGKGDKKGKGRKGPPLDKRMLKDKRAQKKLEKKGKGRKGGGGGRKGGVQKKAGKGSRK